MIMENTGMIGAAEAHKTIEATPIAELSASSSSLASAPTSTANAAPSYASLLTLQELVSRLASHVHAAHDEIGETRAILRDAIERLMPAFTKPGNTFDLPSTTLAAGAGAESANLNHQARDAASASASAFNALQFQDISDQLLAHAQCRLNSLVRELDRIAQSVEPANLIRRDSITSYLLQQVELVNDNLAELDLSLSKPVSKAHLGVGEMELF